MTAQSKVRAKSIGALLAEIVTGEGSYSARAYSAIKAEMGEASALDRAGAAHDLARRAMTLAAAIIEVAAAFTAEAE